MYCSITVLSIGLVDFIVSIVQRYSQGGSYDGSIGYSAHIGGGTAGILIGMNVLHNFQHKVIFDRELRLKVLKVYMLLKVVPPFTFFCS